MVSERPEPPPATLRAAFIGEVDHGKSTLLGRLLYDTGAMTMDRLTAAIDQGGLAFLLDGLIDEQEGLFTLDTAQAVVEFGGRRYVLIDVPGHLTLLKNMVTGASMADIGVLVIDATERAVEQTLLHLRILALLGVTTAVCAVTKMDLVGYNEASFRAAADEAIELAAKCGIDVRYVFPVSALAGVNVVGATDSSRMPWYTGPSLLDALHETEIPSLRSSALRLSTQGVVGRHTQRRLLALVESGTLRCGQTLVDGSGALTCTVKRIERFCESPLVAACAGDSVGLLIDGEEPPAGILLSPPDEPLRWGRLWKTRVLSTTGAPFAPGDDCSLRHRASLLYGRITAVADLGGTDPRPTLGALLDVEILLRAPAAADDWRGCPPLGRFVLATPVGAALGVGIILDVGEGREESVVQAHGSIAE